MSFLSADDITQAEHYTKQTEVKQWLILILYKQTEVILAKIVVKHLCLTWNHLRYEELLKGIKTCVIFRFLNGLINMM